MALLDMKDVRGGYGDADVLHGVSITVGEREIVVIVGPNGAGKSTAMKAVFGLLTVRGRDHLVPLRGEGDPQCAHQLGIVVGDQDLHSWSSVPWAMGRETTIVRPPPGVSSGSMVPPIPSTKPRESASPRPRPVVLSTSPRR